MSFVTVAMAGAAAISVAGGVIGAMGAQSAGQSSAAGARFRGKAEHDTAYYNAGLDEYSANISERDRGVAVAQSIADAKDVRTKNIAEMGQIRAAYGASGLSLEGSPLDVLEASAVEGNMDIRKTLYAGVVTAAGLTDRAAMARAHASLLRTQGDNALMSGDITAGAALDSANYQSAASLISGVSGAFRSFTPALPRA